MDINQLIILGGGSSIKPELENLQRTLDYRWTFALNYAYQFFPGATCSIYVDHKFYTDEKERLKNLPLIIGKFHNNLHNKTYPNTIMLKSCSNYDPTLKKGVYKASLVGIFSLTLAIYFLNEDDEIYLLGYDFGNADKTDKDKKGRAVTHFYQGTDEDSINHRGIGKICYYESHRRGHSDFGCYHNSKVKIYNVCPESRLDEFPKITYSEFYNRLNKRYNQEELRKYMVDKLKKDKICIE